MFIILVLFDFIVWFHNIAVIHQKKNVVLEREGSEWHATYVEAFIYVFMVFALAILIV